MRCNQALDTHTYIYLHPLSGITVLQKKIALTRESYLHEKVTETRNKNKKVE